MSAGALLLRVATEADFPALAALYAASVRAVGPSHYSEVQVRTWASFAEGPAIRRWLREADLLVAEDETGPVGFAGLADDGHVTALYVRPDRMRRGVGGHLLGAVMARAAARGLSPLYTEASAFSRPVFERFGFETVDIETVERSGVRFERYRMTHG